jgi:ribose 5-phosphate isomerase B
MRLGVAADHGGFELKQKLAEELKSRGHEVIDFGATRLVAGDDYPDYVAPLARAVADGRVERGIALCGSGVGACITANKIRGVRAAVIQDTYSARQGVQDDNMNLICLGGRVTGPALARDLIGAFIGASFLGEDRFKRRLAKISALEKEA